MIHFLVFICVFSVSVRIATTKETTTSNALICTSDYVILFLECIIICLCHIPCTKNTVKDTHKTQSIIKYHIWFIASWFWWGGERKLQGIFLGEIIHHTTRFWQQPKHIHERIKTFIDDILCCCVVLCPILRKKLYLIVDDVYFFLATCMFLALLLLTRVT